MTGTFMIERQIMHQCQLRDRVRRRPSALVQAGTVMVAAAAMVACSARADAAPDAVASDRLARTKTATCTFSAVASVDWTRAGEPHADVKPSTLSIAFEGINADEGTARLVGSVGPVDIIVRLSNGVLHFVQSFREGPLYATSIFPAASDSGRLLAVHTRHEFTDVHVPGYTWRPEQYYGTCAIDP
jgi:hypothetical protein